MSPRLRVSSLVLAFLLLSFALNFTTSAQPRRSGAHATTPENFTAADRTTVERAIGTACAERIRDPFGSAPIDEMQARPSLSVNDPEAVAGLQRGQRLLPSTRRLVANAIVQLAKDYGFYRGGWRGRVNASVARVHGVKQVRPNVDARDNASVLLRNPRAIEFGTIFLAGLRSDEAMISVLAHELTHVASGHGDALRPLFRAIARRAAVRTGLVIQGQRAEELGCDLVGLVATKEFIRTTPSWEPQPRRLARAVAHNCVEDDGSDEDHLSPRNTIRALFSLDLNLARELLAGDNPQALLPKRTSLTVGATAF